MNTGPVVHCVALALVRKNPKTEVTSAYQRDLDADLGEVIEEVAHIRFTLLKGLPFEVSK